jgi:transcriptional regulator NrdR family protein
MRVQRKEGGEEDFVREKIVVAIIKAGGSIETARGIAREVEAALSNSPMVTTAQIRTEVLNRLRTRDSRAYDSWMAYDARNSRTR